VIRGLALPRLRETLEAHGVATHVLMGDADDAGSLVNLLQFIFSDARTPTIDEVRQHPWLAAVDPSLRDAVAAELKRRQPAIGKQLYLSWIPLPTHLRFSRGTANLKEAFQFTRSAVRKAVAAGEQRRFVVISEQGKPGRGEEWSKIVVGCRSRDEPEPPESDSGSGESPGHSAVHRRRTALRGIDAQFTVKVRVKRSQTGEEDDDTQGLLHIRVRWMPPVKPTNRRSTRLASGLRGTIHALQASQSGRDSVESFVMFQQCLAAVVDHKDGGATSDTTQEEMKHHWLPRIVQGGRLLRRIGVAARRAKKGRTVTTVIHGMKYCEETPADDLHYEVRSLINGGEHWVVKADVFDAEQWKDPKVNFSLFPAISCHERDEITQQGFEVNKSVHHVWAHELTAEDVKWFENGSFLSPSALQTPHRVAVGHFLCADYLKPSSVFLMSKTCVEQTYRPSSVQSWESLYVRSQYQAARLLRRLSNSPRDVVEGSLAADLDVQAFLGRSEDVRLSTFFSAGDTGSAGNFRAWLRDVYLGKVAKPAPAAPVGLALPGVARREGVTAGAKGVNLLALPVAARGAGLALPVQHRSA